MHLCGFAEQSLLAGSSRRPLYEQDIVERNEGHAEQAPASFQVDEHDA